MESAIVESVAVLRIYESKRFNYHMQRPYSVFMIVAAYRESNYKPWKFVRHYNFNGQGQFTDFRTAQKELRKLMTELMDVMDM